MKILNSSTNYVTTYQSSFKKHHGVNQYNPQKADKALFKIGVFSLTTAGLGFLYGYKKEVKEFIKSAPKHLQAYWKKLNKNAKEGMKVGMAAGYLVSLGFAIYKDMKKEAIKPPFKLLKTA